MSNRTVVAARTAIRCTIVALAMAASIVATGSAGAQGHNGDRGRGPDQFRHQGHDNGKHRGAEQRGRQGRGHNWEREHWLNGYRAYGREPARRPDIYRSAPPVVHLAPTYYRPQPGISLNFGFPLYN